MKKAFFLILVLILSLSLQGCTSIFGGMHQRELGEYTSFVSDGKSEYLMYNIFIENGYIEINDGSFKIYNKDLEKDSLVQVDKCVNVVMSERILDNYVRKIDIEDKYSYLPDQIFEAFNNPKNFEVVILEKDKNLYGAINCYKRSSGRSGNLLSNEDLDKAYIFSVVNKKIKITKTLNKTAILAFNESHYVAYSDKQFYSADKNSKEKIKICDDIWWDKGPTFYSYVNVYFVDDVFLICGNRATINNQYNTLIVGNISGENIETLINDKKVK